MIITDQFTEHKIATRQSGDWTFLFFGADCIAIHYFDEEYHLGGIPGMHEWEIKSFPTLSEAIGYVLGRYLAGDQ